MLYKIYKEYNPDSQNSLSYNNKNKEKYGNITWGYLHTLSISYPFFPSDENKKNMKNILFAVANLYPCGKCGNHWKNILDETNFDYVLNSRDNLMLWLCEKHNEINKKLGKKKFQCNKENLYNKWNL